MLNLSQQTNLGSLSHINRYFICWRKAELQNTILYQSSPAMIVIVPHTCSTASELATCLLEWLHTDSLWKFHRCTDSTLLWNKYRLPNACRVKQRETEILNLIISFYNTPISNSVIIILDVNLNIGWAKSVSCQAGKWPLNILTTSSTS